MATYNITLDKRTLLGKNLFKFLVGMNYVDESTPTVAEIDERTSEGRKVTQVLYDLGIIKSPYNKEFVEKVKRAQKDLQQGLGITVTDVNEL